MKKILKIRQLIIFLISINLFTLPGCSTNKIIPQQTTPEQHIALAKRFQNQATLASHPYALNYQLQASTHFIQAGKFNEAEEVLRQLVDAPKEIDVSMRQSIFEARLSLQKNDSSRALNLIKMMQSNLAKTMPMVNNLNGSKKIALLLPSKGPHSVAAKTIREGFFAAFYKTLGTSHSEATVQIFDTSAGVEEAYQKALADQAALIVGPLTKTEVQKIAHISLDIPVLALNTLTQTSDTQRKLYQFGLIPEDEVSAIMLQARHQGHSRALVIAPQNPMGQRLASTFKMMFESKGGKIIDHLFINSSEHLSEKIATILKSSSHGRRNDIDMIFLATDPELGRQIKPLLDLHKANDLPVYATASIYSGSPNPGKDLDLNGIRFCDMPWVLNNSADLREARQKVAELWPDTFANSSRYFALGMDAYQLAAKIVDNTLPVTHISGLTGELSIDRYQHIQRKLVCAKFEHGVPIPD